MQDRYAGDIGDFAKYGLLRALCGDDLRLGVLWYLVPDEPGDGNGGVTGYLDSPTAPLRACDPDLFDELRDLVATKRSVAEVQRRRILPEGTAFFDEVLGFEPRESPIDRSLKRDRWLQRGLDTVREADVVFVDPDNGLEPRRTSPTAANGPKYAYHDDLARCWERGQSIIIYQHAKRQPIDQQIKELIDGVRTRFGRALNPIVLRWRRRVARYFVILPAEDHGELLAARVRALLSSPWGQRRRGYQTAHFELVGDIPQASPSREAASDTTADILAFALELADAADAIAMRDYRGEHAVERKADGTYVTPADREIETLLRERIAERYPAHAVLGEEQGDDEGAGDAEARWILDPIDGTHNYMRGIPVWGTLIACERGGSIEIGVVSAPALGTRWWAGRGLGAYRGATGARGAGERIRVSEAETIAEAQLVYGETLATLERWPGARALLGEAWRVRGLGDFWGFCLVAEGAADLMLDGVDLHPWDVAALIPIVEEAGGRITDAEGGPSEGAGARVASNGRLHDEVLRRLAGPA